MSRAMNIVIMRVNVAIYKAKLRALVDETVNALDTNSLEPHELASLEREYSATLKNLKKMEAELQDEERLEIAEAINKLLSEVGNDDEEEDEEQAPDLAGIYKQCEDLYRSLTGHGFGF